MPRVITSSKDFDAVFQASFDRRAAFWRQVGDLEADRLGHFISPIFFGEPAWPTTSQGYRVVRRGDSVLLATDGLSDPFDDVKGEMPNGFEIELVLETPDLAPKFRGKPGEVMPLADSWAYAVLTHIAGEVALNGGINEMLDRYGAISFDVPGVSRQPAIVKQIPPRFVTADDCVGLLVGAPAPDFPASIEGMPLSQVRIAPIVVITAAELQAIRVGKRTSRDALLAALAASPTGHRSSLTRPSLENLAGR